MKVKSFKSNTTRIAETSAIHIFCGDLVKDAHLIGATVFRCLNTVSVHSYSFYMYPVSA